MFRVKGAVKPCILQVFRVSAPYFCSFFPFRPFFLDFQVPARKDVPSIRFTYEIVHFPQNLPDPFLELLFRHRLASGQGLGSRALGLGSGSRVQGQGQGSGSSSKV